MKIKIIHTALLLLTATTLFAQKVDIIKPDTSSTYYKGLAIMRQLATEPTSALYYPKLIKRFVDNDTSLTSVEMAGMIWAFSKTKPYTDYKSYIDSLNNMIDAYNNMDYKKASGIGESLFSTHPLYMSLLFKLATVYVKTGNKQKEELCYRRINQIAQGITQTGDGTIDYPYFQLDSEDDEILLQLNGYELVHKENMMDGVSDPIKINVVDCLDNNKESAVVFFDVTEMFTRNFVYEMKKKIAK